MFLNNLMKLGAKNMIKASAIMAIMLGGISTNNLNAYTTRYRPEASSVSNWQNFSQLQSVDTRFAVAQNVVDNWDKVKPTISLDTIFSPISQKFNDLSSNISVAASGIHVDPQLGMIFETAANKAIGKYNNSFIYANGASSSTQYSIMKNALAAVKEVKDIIRDAQNKKLLRSTDINNIQDNIKDIESAITQQIKSLDVDVAIKGDIKSSIKDIVNQLKGPEFGNFPNMKENIKKIESLYGKNIKKSEIVNILNSIKKGCNNAVNSPQLMEKASKAIFNIEQCRSNIDSSIEVKLGIRSAPQKGFFNNLFHR